jgi:choline kinase
VNARPDTAVILAAGRGSRLNEIGKVQPKGFIRIGDLPIVEESVMRLTIAGMRRIVIVTGHLSDHYARLAMRYRDTITLVHNSVFFESGSMHSLHLARQQLQGDFLLLDSDLIYEQRALTELLADTAENVLLVSQITGSGDEVYIEARDRLLQRLSKEREQLGADVLGEMVGISKISRNLFEEMTRFAETDRRLGYEYAIVGVAARTPVHCRLVNDLVWTEIDNTDDLVRASLQVYPMIIDRDGRLNHG